MRLISRQNLGEEEMNTILGLGIQKSMCESLARVQLGTKTKKFVKKPRNIRLTIHSS